jgi:hypothetical protein
MTAKSGNLFYPIVVFVKVLIRRIAGKLDSHEEEISKINVTLNSVFI